MRTVFGVLSVAGALCAVVPTARAGDVHWSVGVNLGGVAIGVAGGGRVHAPPPMMVAPAPVCAPPRVVLAPPPFYPPARVVVVPAPRRVPPPTVFAAGPMWGAPYRIGCAPRPIRHHHHGHAGWHR